MSIGSHPWTRAGGQHLEAGWKEGNFSPWDSYSCELFNLDFIYWNTTLLEGKGLGLTLYSSIPPLHASKSHKTALWQSGLRPTQSPQAVCWEVIELSGGMFLRCPHPVTFMRSLVCSPEWLGGVKAHAVSWKSWPWGHLPAYLITLGHLIYAVMAHASQLNYFKVYFLSSFQVNNLVNSWFHTEHSRDHYTESWGPKYIIKSWENQVMLKGRTEHQKNFF